MVTIANSDCHRMSDSDCGFFSIIRKEGYWLLGLDNFLDLYYKALDVQIKKINKQMILKDNSGESASHPVFQANNLNNAKSVNNAVMFHPSWGTDGSERATKPWERNWMTQR